MAVLPNISNTLDYSLNDKEARQFLIELEQQPLCRFQILIIPHPDVFRNLIYDPLSVVSLLTIPDNAHIGRFYIQTIELPMPSFEYTRVGNRQYVTDVIYPETCSMTFVDGKDSRCQKYLSRWQDEVIQGNSIDILGTIQAARQMVKGFLGSVDAEAALEQKFKSDPGLAKKNIFVIPLRQDDSPAKLWYALEGVVIKTLEPITFDQSTGDPLKLSATFALDNARMMKPF